MLKNSFDLVKYYYNDALKGFLNKPFLKNKCNRVMIMITVFIAYFTYFLMNMYEVGKIGRNARSISSQSLLSITRITISSYVNMIIIMAIVLYVFINSMISLTNSSIYITSILPYSDKEVLIAKKLFKLSICFIGFEAMFIVVFPLFFKLETITVLDSIVLLILFHIIFLCIYFMMDGIYAMFIKGVQGINHSKILNIKLILDYFFVIFSFYYLFILRFPIDSYIGNININLSKLIFIYLGVFTILLLLIVYLSYHFNLDIPQYKKTSFNTKKSPLIKLNLATTMPAIYRHKSFNEGLFLLLVFTLINYFFNGFDMALETFADCSFLIMISAIHYEGNVSKIRKFYRLYKISFIREIISLLLSGIILSAVPIISIILLNRSIFTFILSMSVFLAALIMGLIFPTMSGNLNETAATTLTLFIVAIIYIIIKNGNILISLLMILILISILTIFIKKEYEIR